MLFASRLLVPFALCGALACSVVLASSANADAASRRDPQGRHQRQRAQSSDPQDGYSQAEIAGDRRGRAQSGYGDTSGFPGGNEFDPTAPFGGQAAVTAQPGTDAYKIEMQQRRRYCIVYSNRC